MCQQLDPRETLSKRKNFIILGLGPLLFGTFLYLFVGASGVGEIAESLRKVDLPLYSLAFVIVLLDTFFFSLAWQRLLTALSVKVPVRKAFEYTWIGLFVDILIPAESVTGELSRIYLLSRDKAGNPGEIVAALLSHRIINTMVMLGGLTVGTSLFLRQSQLDPRVLTVMMSVILITAIFLVFLILAAFEEGVIQKAVVWMLQTADTLSGGRWNLLRLRQRINEALSNFNRGNEILRRNQKGLLESLALSVVAWLLHLLVSFTVFLSLGQQISFSILIVVFCISSIVEMIPFGLAGIGFAEIVTTSSYALFGIPVETSAAATILIRLVTVWFRFTIGYAVLQWNGMRKADHPFR